MALTALAPWIDTEANRPASGDRAGRTFVAYDTGQVSIWTGSAWTAITTAGSSIVKTADGSAVTDTTLVSDATLTANLEASTSYDFRFLVFFNNAGAAEGFKAALSGTVGVSALKAQISIFDDTLNTLVGFGRVTALGSSIGAGLSSGDNFAVVEGSITTTTGGTFVLQSAQNAAGAGAGVTVQANSLLVLGRAGAQASTKHQILAGVVRSQTEASQTVNVNSVTYVGFSSLRFGIDFTAIPYTHFRIVGRAAASAGGETITGQLALAATPTVALSAGGDDFSVTGVSLADVDTGWLAFASPLSGFNLLVVALKGSAGTTDLVHTFIDVLLKKDP